MIIQPRLSSWPFPTFLVGLFILCAIVPRFWMDRSDQPHDKVIHASSNTENSTDKIESNPIDLSQSVGDSNSSPANVPLSAQYTNRENGQISTKNGTAAQAIVVKPQDNAHIEISPPLEEVKPSGKYLREATDPSERTEIRDVSLASNQEPLVRAELHEPSSVMEETAPERSPATANATSEGLAGQSPEKSPPAPVNSVRVANLPTNSIHQLPELSKPDLKELLQSNDLLDHRTSPSMISGESPAELAKKNWYQPTSLLASLDELSNIAATSAWAKEANALVGQLGPALARDSREAVQITARLAVLLQKLPALTDQLSAAAQKARLYPQKVEYWNTIRKLRKAGYALERRLEIWRAVAQLGSERLENPEGAAGDPGKLSICLANVEATLPGTVEGERWRDYLMLSALEQSALRHSEQEAEKQRQIAQWILERIDQTPMSNRQRQFINQPQVIALRAELRRWAADPVSAADVLKTVERYEQSGLVSDARQLARELQSLAVSPDAARQDLARRVDAYYRNANLRVAISEKMLNRLIPAPNMEYAPVHDTVLGVPVHGQSLTKSDLAIRLIPDPDHARLALEVTGEVAATTSSTSGPATFYNDSEAVYAAQKQVEINKKGFRLLPAEVDVRHQTRLRDVATDFDGIPLFGFFARKVAQTQHDLYRDSANGEARQKVAAKARERIDNQALDQFSKMVDKLNQNVFGPLVNLSLEPTIIDAQTTAERLTMRLRVAGEDQLGSNTPRPQAPMDCLASFQVHESMLNNALQRLQLEGNTFTLKQLSERFSERLQRPNVWQVNPEHEDVKITFAEKDAVTVDCRDGQVVLSLSVAELSKAPHGWQNFQVSVVFKPEINGRSAELTRSEAIHLNIEHVSLKSQIALRGVFSKAFPSNQRVNIMPERFLNDANLKDLNVTQFTIDDGWIGVAIGDKAREVRTARLPGR
jgi:hypothetical protein